MPKHPRFDEIISKFAVQHVSGNVHSCVCPAHLDDHASLHITPTDDGKILVNCKADCPTPSVLAAVGLKMSDLFPPKEKSEQAHSRKPTVVDRYPYTDAGGNLLYVVTRLSNKEFPVSRPDGNGGWVGGLGDTPRVLYQLPSIIKAIQDDIVVFVVEGEKDCRTLHDMLCVATTNPGGKGQGWLDSYSECLTAAHVIILPDNDTPGCTLAMNAACSIAQHAASVKYAQLPGLPPHGDVSDWIHKQKHTREEFLEFIEYNSRDWFAGCDIQPSPDARAKTVGHDGVRPVITISNRQLRDITTDTIAALESDHEHNALYIRMNKLVRLRTRTSSKIAMPIIEDASVDIVRSLMSQAADYSKFTPKGDEVTVFPPVDVAHDVIARGRWEFPQLDAVTESPVIRPDGSILSEPGHDEVTHLFYASTGLQLPEVPDNPSVASVNASREMIFDILADFPFVADADRTNLIAMMLTQIIRPAIDGLIPMGIINAPQPGSGKGLLAKVISLIATGKSVSSVTAPTKPEEWTKQLTAILAGGATMIVFDNVETVLDSPDLASFLTASSWTARILGVSKIISVPNRSTVLVTGNNVQVAGDIARRCYWSTINPNMSAPELRSGFRHPNICRYVLENRGAILSSLFTLARAWFVAGQPAPQVPPLGSFEEWAETIGGILELAGVPGFLANAEQIKAASDISACENEQFLEAIYTAYRNLPFTIKELNEQVGNDSSLCDAVPDYLLVARAKSEAGFVRSCGKLFARITGRRYGADNIAVQRNPVKGTGSKTKWFTECDNKDIIPILPTPEDSDVVWS